MATVRRVVVVGAGLSGLMTTVALAEAGVPVDLLSLVPAKRAPSVTLDDGINAVAEGTEDSPAKHLRDTLSSGGSFASESPVRGMVESAPALVDLFDRMGIPFLRTNEGRVDRIQSPGSEHARTAIAGDATGQLLLYGLDEQIRRLEDQPVRDDSGATVRGEKVIRRFEYWDAVDLVRDGKGNAAGVVAQDLKTMRVRAFPADAVVLATGDASAIFGRGAVLSTGSALAMAFQAGAAYANADLFEIHPLTIALEKKLRAIPVDVLKDGANIELEGLDEADARAAARLIVNACLDEEGKLPRDAGVTLSLAGMGLRQDDKTLVRRLGLPFAIHARRAGVPLEVRVFPSVERTLGGLWVDSSHATNIPGLYAVGDVQYQYHGARRLPGNAALACVYGATLAAPAVRAYREGAGARASDLPRSTFEKAEKAADAGYARILGQNEGESDTENAYVIAEDLRSLMFRELLANERAPGDLLKRIGELVERAKRVRTTDTSQRLNQGTPFIRHLERMLVLARVIAASSLRRESAGKETLLALADGDDIRFVSELD